MTREEFKDLWDIEELIISPTNAASFVGAETKYKGDALYLYFDCFTEDELYDLGYDFFRQLKERLSELDDFAKNIIKEQELNWNDVEVKLSEIRIRKPYNNNNEGYYHAFALTYYGGEVYDDDDNLIDNSSPDLLLMNICFDKNFNFIEAFDELEMID